jgi:hypothetical protein
MSLFGEIFKSKRVIGIVGSRNSAKSSLALYHLLELKKEFPNTKIYCLGVEEKLRPYLEKNGIKFLNSSKTLLDLRLRDSVIFVDEFGDLFSTRSRDRQQDKLVKFFNRINHQNCFFVLTSARQGFWNKFLCGVVNTFIVCRVEFNELVNGTIVKDIVKSIETTSDYFLDINAGQFYVFKEDLVEKLSFPYCADLDSKKDNVNPFHKITEKNVNKKA